MASLHSVTENTKIVLKWGGLVIGIIVGIILIIRFGLYLKDVFYPTPPPPPTVAFGQLPPITFPTSVTNKEYTFVVDTVSGRLPVFLNPEETIRDRISVYTITHKDLTLLDLQEAKKMVANVGFTGTEFPVSKTEYRWFSRNGDLTRALDVDIVSKNFSISSPFRTNSRIISAFGIPDESRAKGMVDTFLKEFGNSPADLDRELTRTQLLKIQGQALVAVDTYENAQIIRVDLYQKNIEDLPIYYPEAPLSAMNFFIGSGEQFDPEIVQSLFFHQTITEDFATYPLKPVQTAFEELEKGQAYTSADFISGNEVKIKDVLLGYYASDTKQDYLMPVYVFKGTDDQFYAFVSAVDNTWIKTESNGELEE